MARQGQHEGQTSHEMTNSRHRKPSHCEVIECTNVPSHRAHTDNGCLWVCPKHKSRWNRHRSFTLPKHQIQPITHSEHAGIEHCEGEHPGGPTSSGHAGRPGLSDLGRLTTETENGQADATDCRFSSKLTPSPAHSKYRSYGESLSNAEIVARYGSTISDAVIAFALDANYAASIVERAKRIRHITKDNPAVGS